MIGKKKFAAQTFQKWPCFQIYGPELLKTLSRYFAKVGRNPENVTMGSMGLDIQEITFSFSCG